MVPWCQHHQRQIPLAGIDGKKQVSLFSPGRKPGGRTRSLGIGYDHRNLPDTGQAYRLCHQGKTSPGGPGHGTDTAKGGTQGHIYSRNLILSLFHYKAQFLLFTGQIIHDTGSRRHGIGNIKLHTGNCCSHGQGIIAIDINLITSPAGLFQLDPGINQIITCLQ